MKGDPNSHKVAIVKARGDIDSVKAETLKTALDAAGIESEIVDPQSFKLSTEGTIRILADDFSSRVQHWVVNKLDDSDPRAVACKHEHKVRVTLPAIELPKTKQLHIGARARKRWNEVQSRSSGRVNVAELKYMSLPKSTLDRIRNRLVEHRDAKQAKRDRFLSKFRVPTKRLHRGH